MVTVTAPTAKLGSKAPEIEVDGWNVKKEVIATM